MKESKKVKELRRKLAEVEKGLEAVRSAFDTALKAAYALNEAGDADAYRAARKDAYESFGFDARWLTAEAESLRTDIYLAELEEHNVIFPTRATKPDFWDVYEEPDLLSYLTELGRIEANKLLREAKREARIERDASNNFLIAVIALLVAIASAIGSPVANTVLNSFFPQNVQVMGTTPLNQGPELQEN